jgi:hypothetical protein
MSFCILFFLINTVYTEERTISPNDLENHNEPIALSVTTGRAASLQEKNDISDESTQQDFLSGNQLINSGTDTLHHRKNSIQTNKKTNSSTKIVFSKEFYIAPNPVTKSDLNCNFFINSKAKGTADLRIYDPTGNEIVFYSGSVVKYGCNKERPFYSWNMRNRGGRTVSIGTYLAIITLRNNDGKVQTFRRKIGYKRE